MATCAVVLATPTPVQVPIQAGTLSLGANLRNDLAGNPIYYGFSNQIRGKYDANGVAGNPSGVFVLLPGEISDLIPADHFAGGGTLWVCTDRQVQIVYAKSD